MSVKVRGTTTRVRLTRPRRARSRGFACPDGVTRLVTLGDWMWEALDRGCDPAQLARHVTSAWKMSQVFAEWYDAERVFAAWMEETIHLFHRWRLYPADNNNRRAAVIDRLPRKQGLDAG